MCGETGKSEVKLSVSVLLNRVGVVLLCVKLTVCTRVLDRACLFNGDRQAETEKQRRGGGGISRYIKTSKKLMCI